MIDAAPVDCSHSEAAARAFKEFGRIVTGYRECSETITNDPMKTKTSPLKKSFRFPLLASAIAAALMAICPAQTRANTVALDFTGGNGFVADGITFGWAFSLSSAVLLTDLGVWDFGSDGLGNSYPVTIWTSAGVQVAQATVPSGTSGTLVDEFRYVSVAPTLLAPGNYTIAAYYTGFADFVIENAATITTASGVTYQGSKSEFGNAFPSGDQYSQPNSFFGPNFQFTTAVPDAGNTFLLMLGSVVALLLLRRATVDPPTRRYGATSG